MTCRPTPAGPRVLPGRHRDDCDDPDQCPSCLPCPARHCRLDGATHVGPDEQTCPACIGAVRTDLADIAHLAADLPDQALTGSSGGHILAAAPIPGADAATMLGPWSPGRAQGWERDTHARAGTGNLEHAADPSPPLLTLATWQDDWEEVLGLELTDTRATVDGCVAWLSTHLADAAQAHDAFDEFADEMRALRVRLEQVLHAGERDERGPACLAEGCGATLRRPYAPPVPCPHDTPARRQARAWATYGPVPPDLARADAAPCRRAGCDQGGLRNHWTCPRCRHECTDAEVRLAQRAELEDADPLRTTAQLATLLGVTPARIRLWAHRGHITRAGSDTRGRTLYDLAEVRQCAMLMPSVAC